MGWEEIKAVGEVLQSGWIGLGPKTKQFEDEFAKYIGCEHAVAVSSCTHALQLALKVFGINSGEVIVPAITFISTALAANYNNATPVFADVYEDTLCIDIDDIKRKITDKTRAIIPVHYGGHPCEMAEINEIAKEHKLTVIEDCAHSCGAEYKGKKTGNLADAGCFSFHAVKNLATGDGGMITLNDKGKADKLKKVRWMGINKDTFTRSGTQYDWYYEVEELGHKMHTNDILATIGLVQLKKLDQMNAKRRKIVEAYSKAFGGLGWQLPVEKDHVKSAMLSYPMKVNSLEERDALIKFLKEKGISTGVHYMPLHLHPIYKEHESKARVPIAEEIWHRLVLLPVFVDMTNDELEYVITSVKTFKGL